jgi:preprotein translocase subunit YajC
MELTELGQLIGTLGFPIVACCVVFWYLQKESENHKQEMTSMRDAVNANTSVIADLKMLMQQLIDKLT